MKKITTGLFLGQSLAQVFVISSAALAEPPGRQIESLAFTCFTCHEPNGDSPGKIPSIRSLEAKDITEKLLTFRQDQGDPTIMNRIAKGYSESEIMQIAEYLAKLK